MGPSLPIHPHVEDFVAPERESASFGIELQRRHAQVGECAVDAIDASRIEHRRQRPVVGMDQLEAIAVRGERRRRERERVGIAVEADHARRTRVEERTRVSTEPDRTVHEESAAGRRQPRHHLGREHRFVDRHHQPPP